MRDKAVLLVKHTYQRDWYLPGGGVKRGETLEEAARREAAEELGAELRNIHLFGIYSNFYEHKSDHVVVFTCDDFTIVGEMDMEIERFGWFRFDRLPADISPGSLRRVHEHLEGGNRPYISVW